MTLAVERDVKQQINLNLRRENSQLQDIQGQKGGQELIWFTSQEIQGAVDHHGAEAKSCKRHCVNMCGTTYHVEKPSGETDHPLQLMTYNHHRVIKGNRDIKTT